MPRPLFPPPPSRPGDAVLRAALSRRSLLLGAAAAGVLAACGDDDTSDASGAPDDSRPSDGDDRTFSVIRFFGAYFVAGAASRVPFGLSDDDGLLPADLAPAELAVTVADFDGNVVAEDVPATLHAEGLPRPYYAFEFTPPTAGFYDFSFETEVGTVMSQLQVVEPDDLAVASFVGPGEAMPAVATPTEADPMGVTPICTREPACDLHGVSYADVVGTAPSVLLVSTPAFCQIAVCGPILDILLELIPDFPDIRFVHAEVYRDPEQNQVPPVPDDFAPVVGELGLPFEPVLYAVDATGTVVDRLDYVFDGGEIRAVLDRLVG